METLSAVIGFIFSLSITTPCANGMRFRVLSLFGADPAALAAIPVVGALMYYSWKRNRKEIVE
jgi:hypothetical protein